MKQGSVARSPVSAGADQLLADRFRCPEETDEFLLTGTLSGEPGYFRLGPDVICYGQCAAGSPARSVTDPLYDAREAVVLESGAVRLPFNPSQVVNNLRCERYLAPSRSGEELPGNKALRTLYYGIRPLMGVQVRRVFQQFYFRGRQSIPFPCWPVDVTVENLTDQLLVYAMKAQGVDRVPFIWFWPQGNRSCSIISHDVETETGLKFAPVLMDLNDSFGVKTSFQIVPEKRYVVPEAVRRMILERGFEVNVHDLNHDGHLFREREEFLRRAQRINEYGRQFGASGFRSAVMYRNVDWFGALEFSYDMSLPNVAHLDPQKGGCCTVLPFFIGDMLELPVTTSQDYSLFNILKEYSTRLWRQQIERIRSKHGLISVVIHPDYIIESRARRIYKELLEILSDLRQRGETWIATPGEVNAWWRTRNGLKLARTGESWTIEGEGSERARLAYAVLNGDKLSYEIDGKPVLFES